MARSEESLTVRCGALRCTMKGFEDPFTALAALAPWLAVADDGTEPPGWTRVERVDGTLLVRPAEVEAGEEEAVEEEGLLGGETSEDAGRHDETSDHARPIARSPFSDGGAGWARMAPDVIESLHERDDAPPPESAHDRGRGDALADGDGPEPFQREGSDDEILARIVGRSRPHAPTAEDDPPDLARAVSQGRDVDPRSTGAGLGPRDEAAGRHGREGTVVRLPRSAEALVPGGADAAGRAAPSHRAGAADIGAESGSEAVAGAETAAGAEGVEPSPGTGAGGSEPAGPASPAPGDGRGEDGSAPLVLGPSLRLLPLLLRPEQRVETPPGAAAEGEGAPAGRAVGGSGPVRPRRVRR